MWNLTAINTPSCVVVESRGTIEIFITGFTVCSVADIFDVIGTMFPHKMDEAICRSMGGKLTIGKGARKFLLHFIGVPNLCMEIEGLFL